MKYAIIEAQNFTLWGDQPSGLNITDGDADEIVEIACVGKMFSSKKEARKALEKYLKKVKNIINQSGDLSDGWIVEEDCDIYSLTLFHREGDEITCGDWVIKCDIVALPENDDEIEEYSCLLDYAKYWWK